MPYIEPYVKGDGTRVRGHYRWAAGARKEMTIFAVVALAVVGMGSGTAGVGGGGQSPAPNSTVRYPIKFEDQPRKAGPEPKETVSYPIKFPSAEDER